ncbi:Strubbelig-receptor family [Thalictrum thalictroides]|uniref:Strubbelig-receptor family n=1 Tax=Thalictrum thalictroides TaxID=46969 RepID=A0A7J6W233_THATH|nr:Strubbelig-receptor family [Thalictrum thalictroides]
MVRFFLVLLGILVPAVHAKTDQPDVAALTVMYSSLNYPSKLTGWKRSGGDPCGDEWKGITCSGSKVTQIKLSDLGLEGSLGYQLSSLTSVTYFDMSKNNIKGDIPYQLPPNAQHIDFSGNGMTGTVPYSISLMSDLKHLDLGHNLLKGEMSDMFGKMPKLNYMDLSDNQLSGNLPKSFGSLSSLKTLNLQNNKFSGPIDVLAKLPLEQLNVENNGFTGAVPKKLQGIATIQTGGNSFTSGGDLNKIDNKDHKDGKGMSGVTIAMIVIGVLVALVLLLALLSRKSSSSSSASHFLDEEKLSQRRSFTPLVSRELDPPSNFTELKSLQSSASIRVKSLQISPSVKRPTTEKMSSLSDAEFASRLNLKKSTSIRAVPYTLSDLQSATGNFATGRLLGEGSIGRVYRAKYPDGKVVAVKKIDSSLFHNGDPERFSEMITSISKLHHQNIVELVGHCSEQGHNLLVYEYFRNGSLHEFLHLSDDYSKPLTWNTRIRIALGTARAVE